MLVNDTTITAYTLFKFDEKYVAILVTSRLKDKLLEDNPFSYYEKCWILKNSIKTCMNMYKFCMYDLIYSNINVHNFS